MFARGHWHCFEDIGRERFVSCVQVTHSSRDDMLGYLQCKTAFILLCVFDTAFIVKTRVSESVPARR